MLNKCCHKSRLLYSTRNGILPDNYNRMQSNKVIRSSNLGSNSKYLKLDVEILRTKQIKLHNLNRTWMKMKNKIISNSEWSMRNAKDSHSRLLMLKLSTKIYNLCMISTNHQEAMLPSKINNRCPRKESHLTILWCNSISLHNSNKACRF